MEEKEINTGIFDRAALLLGEDVIAALENLNVIVFGVGGVGSWCVESLVRSGVGHLTIVDFDKVDVTNINRQMMATSKTVGQVKVNALAERLLEINPHADIRPIAKLYSEDTQQDFSLEDYDYVIDCIDSLKDKALLIKNTCRSKAKLFSSMGAARKLDPTRVKVEEFREVKGCPLARALRNRFKKEDEWPRRKFKCVYSEELFGDDTRKGSLMHITAVFGLTLAGLLIEDVVNKHK